MASVLLCPPTLAGAETTAKIIKGWLIDDRKTRSGLIGVDSALQVLSLRTFQHSLTQPALKLALDDAFRASATGVLAYSVAEGSQPSFDRISTQQLEGTCNSLNLTLLDVLIFSPNVPNGWISARQQGVI